MFWSFFLRTKIFLMENQKWQQNCTFSEKSRNLVTSGFVTPNWQQFVKSINLQFYIFCNFYNLYYKLYTILIKSRQLHINCRLFVNLCQKFSKKVTICTQFWTFKKFLSKSPQFIFVDLMTFYAVFGPKIHKSKLWTFWQKFFKSSELCTNCNFFWKFLA